MNKADLITALKNETGLTKSEADAVVNLFFNEMSEALANGAGLKSGGYAHFMSSNTKRMPVGIQKLGGRSGWNLRSYRSLSVARN